MLTYLYFILALFHLYTQINLSLVHIYINMNSANSAICRMMAIAEAAGLWQKDSKVGKVPLFIWLDQYGGHLSRFKKRAQHNFSLLLDMLLFPRESGGAGRKTFNSCRNCLARTIRITVSRKLHSGIIFNIPLHYMVTANS